MKKIYIVISFTGTMLSRIIKCYTKDEFAHASIALDKELNTLYSFGRLNPYNPFWGGFVHEGIHIGTFKRFRNTVARIYSMNVTDEQYEKAKAQIKYIEENKKDYKFNVIGMMAVSINKKIHPKNSFYCSQFVKYILDSSGIKTNLPELIKPESFVDLENVEIEYEGKLKEYKPKMEANMTV